jgi:hypothetical protein
MISSCLLKHRVVADAVLKHGTAQANVCDERVPAQLLLL